MVHGAFGVVKTILSTADDHSDDCGGTHLNDGPGQIISLHEASIWNGFWLPVHSLPSSDRPASEWRCAAGHLWPDESTRNEGTLGEEDVARCSGLSGPRVNMPGVVGENGGAGRQRVDDSKSAP